MADSYGRAAKLSVMEELDCLFFWLYSYLQESLTQAIAWPQASWTQSTNLHLKHPFDIA
jgi:hypothetical protein